MIRILAIISFTQIIQSCYLWGTDSGVCSSDTLDPLWRSTYMPYCSQAVTYTACLPKLQILNPSREFPNGRWINNTVTTKDNYINQNCEAHIAYRIGLETNKSLQRANEDEFGDYGKIQIRFYHRPDCQNAYKNYFCWINFPRCDIDRDLTLETCRSACENFFISCGYSKDLWRCGKSKFFNGGAPEEPTILSGGGTQYLRDYFPGQPFTQNKYNKQKQELPICTPAITGGSSIFENNFYMTGFLIFLTAFIMYH